MGEVADEAVHYFRDHPEKIEELSAPVNIHLLALWTGGLRGAVFGAQADASISSKPIQPSERPIRNGLTHFGSKPWKAKLLAGTF